MYTDSSSYLWRSLFGDMFVLNFFLYSRTIRVPLIARMKVFIQDIKYLILSFIHICVLSIAQCSVYNRRVLLNLTRKCTKSNNLFMNSLHIKHYD